MSNVTRGSWLVIVASLVCLPACDPAAGVDAGFDAGSLDGGNDGGRDTGLPDVGPDLDAPASSDTGIDAPAEDAGPADTGMVAMDDAGSDAGSDAGIADGGTDAGLSDAGTDAGTDAGPAPCTGEADCAAALVCLPSATCGCPASLSLTSTEALQISEIAPGSYIEVYNPGTAPLDLGASDFQFCSPFLYSALSGTVPAGGYLMLPWPSAFMDTVAGGEMILYRNSSYGTASSVMDFVCWGTNPHGSRMGTAVGGGKWTAGCAPALTGGAIHRRDGTDGFDPADYDTTSPPSGASCTP